MKNKLPTGPDTINGGDGLPDWMQFTITAGMFGMLVWVLYLLFHPTLSLEEFTTKVNEKKSETFNMSKMMCLKFLDAFLSTNAHKRDHFITELYRYAASNTEQSSYYVKIAD